jgi:hypothetical protein
LDFVFWFKSSITKSFESTRRLLEELVVQKLELMIPYQHHHHHHNMQQQQQQQQLEPIQVCLICGN